MSEPYLKRAHINDLLDLVLEKSAQNKWFATPIPRLNGRTPLQAINDGDYDEVVKVLNGYLAPPSFS